MGMSVSSHQHCFEIKDKEDPSKAKGNKGEKFTFQKEDQCVQKHMGRKQHAM